MMLPYELIILLSLLLLGYVFGRLAERRHYRSIQAREDQYRQLLVLAERHLPPEYVTSHESRLVMGNVVVSVDYFKMMIATLRNLVGGSIGAFESLLDRARREAILRMQEQAAALGTGVVIFNVKLETCRVSGDASRGVGSVEVMAYGTALYPRGNASR
ncbi:YbjQ family protein [Alcanivorax sp. JB21]|uniref:YbjQ family protein n=1 Tax=Alcanivorax limicola TaxID=2874102 RepID=UPI001CBFDE03|nr:heavy metal-binding domain-containing protein [Alcanivorax limicola]MBZ2189736.1 YbjQ family protein [Alcanivorax limicola]